MGTPSQPVIAQTSAGVAIAQNPTSPEALVEEARRLYQAKQFTQALSLLQQASVAFSTTGDVLGQAITFDLQGQVYLSQGQPAAAAESFAAAADAYERGRDETGVIKSKINQAQALRNTGLYRRALDTLKQLNASLNDQTDPLLRAIALRSLGITQRLVGDLNEAKQVIEQSLQIAEGLPSPDREENISAAYLMLGNIAKDQGNTAQDRGETQEAEKYFQEAIAHYKKAAEDATTPTAKIEAQLNALSIVGDRGQPFTDEERELLGQVRETLDQLPLSQTSVNARINWARMAMKPQNQANVNPQDIAQQLIIAMEQAKKLNDPRGESYALGQLGELRLQQGQLEQAEANTKQALMIAQSMGASDIAYRWQWQLGQILKEEGKTEGALAAYDAAVKNLEDLRSDLVSVNRDVQFSFRDNVEPVYREFVGLLLQSKDQEPSPEELAKARDLIESLQQAELVDFFRENCLTANRTQIDDIDQSAAVLYPIVLGNRIEVVVTLPGLPLRHYSTTLEQEQVEDILSRLRNGAELARGGLVPVARDPNEAPPPAEDYLPLAQQVYEWLIKPFEEDLAKSGVETLVFVLDGPLLNLPMSILHDGEQFLVEKYAIAQTPGLQLLDSKPLTKGELTVLKGGLSEAVQEWSALPNVEQELESLKNQLNIPGTILFNEEFTTKAIQNALESIPFPVVHLATHGQFSSNPENTFLLTWDGRLSIEELKQVLQGREEGGKNAIELLVLSACETATGDRRAALGLAGVAVRAGARSTLATLWQVDDEGTANLMLEFYRQLKEDKTISKAEALRRAQLSFIQQDNKFKQPFYWAPFVLVGNWL